MQFCMAAFDWSDARVFLAIERCGSLSAAGRQLRVEQSTVGRRLASLEAQLGARLFDRTPEGYLLTGSGERLLAHAEAMEAEALAAEREVGGDEERLAGVVRLTAPQLFGAAFVVPLLAGFRRAQPDVVVELVADNTTLSLSRREADLALRLHRPTQPLLVTRRLADVATTLYGSETYLAARGRPRRDLADLGAHDLVDYDDSYQPDLEVRWLRKYARAARVVFRANSAQAMLSAVEAGMGLALLPCYAADRVPGLVRVGPAKEVVVRGLWLVLHRDLRHAARIRALADWLVAAIAENAGLLRARRGG
jgi:DNA-binding transcriptional LysR family regulator